MSTDNTAITIHRNDLHCQYSGQINPQDCYVWLDGHDVGASYNAEIATTVPLSVWHGTIRRYHLPFILTGQATNNLMEHLTPLLQRVADGFTEEWDGSNFVGQLTDDAQAAESQIEQEIDTWCDASDCSKPCSARAAWFDRKEIK